jgi:hypothetical protein
MAMDNIFITMPSEKVLYERFNGQGDVSKDFSSKTSIITQLAHRKITPAVVWIELEEALQSYNKYLKTTSISDKNLLKTIRVAKVMRPRWIKWLLKDYLDSITLLQERGFLT